MEPTLEQKLGQLIISGFRGTLIDNSSKVLKYLRHNHLRNLWLVDNESPMAFTEGNIESSDQLKRLTSSLQSYGNNSLMLAIDLEGGEVVRLKEKYGFPKINSPQYFGNLDDISETRRNALMIAELLNVHGINMNFAPVVDVNINPECPAIGKRGRSFSGYPEKVYLHAKEFILAHREKNIATCLKHFPGHGSSVNDTHFGFVDVTAAWSNTELIPYEKLIEDGLADAVMTAHVFNKNLDEKYPATLSKKILTGILREKLGFDGVIFSDDLNMRAVYDYYSYEETIELSFNAGVDVLLQGNVMNYNPEIIDLTFSIIKKLIESGKISEQRIDESFNRVIKLKKKFGINYLS